MHVILKDTYRLKFFPSTSLTYAIKNGEQWGKTRAPFVLALHYDYDNHRRSHIKYMAPNFLRARLYR